MQKNCCVPKRLLYVSTAEKRIAGVLQRPLAALNTCVIGSSQVNVEFLFVFDYVYCL